jgi:hypothetical protein
VPTSSVYYFVVCVLVSYMLVSNCWRCSLFVAMKSPICLSDSFIRFCSADTYKRRVDAAYLSFIISALFSEMAVCISEHMRPYCCIVKLFLSMPFDNITCWLCSIVQLSTTFLSKVLIVLFASISYDLKKAVN